MRLHGNRWITRLITASLFGTALLCPPRIGVAGETQVAMAGPTDSDLLMFWDEKELYVQTATRSEKPISLVAENMTVITAKEIEAMNATSVAEVLSRIPGIFVSFQNNDYNSTSSLSIQGSETRHVTVLLDGMPFNIPGDNNAEVSLIPLRIVERIEIIKGAASSTWGSGLGGVVNILTRSTGDNPLPNGMVAGSYGKSNSRNLETDLRGKNGPLGYYLYAGQLNSDGLRNNRDASRSSLFAKFLLTPTRDLDITLTGGYSDPRISTGDVDYGGGMIIGTKASPTARFLNGAVTYRATPELVVRGGLHLYKTNTDVPMTFAASSLVLPGTLFKDPAIDQQTIGGNLLATWSSGMQTLTAGMEASHVSLTQSLSYGPAYGSPPPYVTSPTFDKWGLFVNDTVEFGPVAVTPGMRVDHDNITGFFYSPSIGATYEISDHTVARASAARGFTAPPATYSSGEGFSFHHNPDIKSEYGWSYQAGLESGVADLVNLKGTLFHHETSHAISLQLIDPTTPSLGQTAKNGSGTVIRQGYELEAETVPYYNLSLKFGHAYAHYSGDTVLTGYTNNYFDNYSWLLGLKYDDRQSLTVLLNGSYIYWDLDPAQNFNPHYTTFIWDLTGTKKFRTSDNTTLETFATVHNLFSGTYSVNGFYPSPGRWIEGGLRFKF